MSNTTVTWITHFCLPLQAEGLTAVETWVVSCIIHVFGVLAEYALILKIIQDLKRQESRDKRQERSMSVTARGERQDKLCFYKPVYKEVCTMFYVKC